MHLTIHRYWRLKPDAPATTEEICNLIKQGLMEHYKEMYYESSFLKVNGIYSVQLVLKSDTHLFYLESILRRKFYDLIHDWAANRVQRTITVFLYIPTYEEIKLELC